MALSRRGLFGGLFKAVLAAPVAAAVINAPAKAEPVPAAAPVAPPPREPLKFRVINYSGARNECTASGYLASACSDGDYVSSLRYPERE